MARAIALFATTLLAACASAPPAPRADRAAIWGYVRLVPRDGVATHAGSASYGDRSVADAVLVDYSKPGFAVVWADGPAPPASDARLAIRDGVAGARIEPAFAALAAGGAIHVTNETASPHVVSCPPARLVRELAPGESLAIAADAAGERALFLLGGDAEARVFAAPGPYQVVSSAGRFALSDLAPGAVALHAWHPRFPATSVRTEAPAGATTRVDLELRVDRATPETTDAP